MKLLEVPLNSPVIDFRISIREAGDEYVPYWDLKSLALEVYNSRPDEHKYGDFYQWYDRLMGLEDLYRLEISIYKGGTLIAAAVLTEVDDIHYGNQVSEVFKVTDGSIEAAKWLVRSYRVAGNVMGFKEYIAIDFKHGGYLRSIRRVHGGTIKERH